VVRKHHSEALLFPKFVISVQYSRLKPLPQCQEVLWERLQPRIPANRPGVLHRKKAGVNVMSHPVENQVKHSHSGCLRIAHQEFMGQQCLAVALSRYGYFYRAGS